LIEIRLGISIAKMDRGRGFESVDVEVHTKTGSGAKNASCWHHEGKALLYKSVIRGGLKRKVRGKMKIETRHENLDLRKHPLPTKLKRRRLWAVGLKGQDKKRRPWPNEQDFMKTRKRTWRSQGGPIFKNLGGKTFSLNERGEIPAFGTGQWSSSAIKLRG